MQRIVIEENVNSAGSRHRNVSILISKIEAHNRHFTKQIKINIKLVPKMNSSF